VTKITYPLFERIDYNDYVSKTMRMISMVNLILVAGSVVLLVFAIGYGMGTQSAVFRADASQTSQEVVEEIVEEEVVEDVIEEEMSEE
jgi:hypothetical protein